MSRIDLTCDTDFYCAPAGDDSNDGLSALTPKRQPQAVWDVLQSDYDLRGRTPRILCAPGAYAPISIRGRCVGQVAPPRIVGSTARGQCSIGGGAKALSIENGEVLIEGFSVSGYDSALSCQFFATLWYRDIDFTAGPAHHIQTQKSANSFYLSKREDGSKSSYCISGDAQDHLYVNGGGVAYLTETINGNGIEFIGTRSFSIAFANIIQGGCLTAHTNAWSGVCNGAALMVRWNSVGGSASQLPGNQALNYCDGSSQLI